MIGVTFPKPRSLFLLAQDRPQSSADESIQPWKLPAAGVLEVAIPASDHRGEVGNDPRQAVASGATCLFAYLVLEPLQALFPYPALSRFEPVAQKLESLPFYSAIPDVGLVGMQGQAVGFDPRFDFFQCCVRLFRALAQDDEVVGVAHHAVALPRHEFVQGVQVEVRQ